MINEIDNKIDTIDITEPCPAEEPFRQYYFIKKARGYYRELAKKAGRNLTCSIPSTSVTFCNNSANVIGFSNVFP